MRIDSNHRVDIELYGDGDIQTMREIVRLAYERIHASPTVQLRGVPLDRQAGLVGPELFRVKEAIEKIGRACGVSLPYEPEQDPGQTSPVRQDTDMFVGGVRIPVALLSDENKQG